MRRLGVSTIANGANAIATPNPFASRDPNASRLHMRVERIRSVSNVQDCEVTVSFVDGKPFRKLTRHLLGKVIACCDHDGVGHGENRLTIDMITARILWIAAKELYFFVDPLPIDGEPL